MLYQEAMKEILRIKSRSFSEVLSESSRKGPGVLLSGRHSAPGYTKHDHAWRGWMTAEQTCLLGLITQLQFTGINSGKERLVHARVSIELILVPLLTSIAQTVISGWCYLFFVVACGPLD